MSSRIIRKRDSKTIVLVSKEQPQIFKFDERVVFDENPISRIFSVELFRGGQIDGISAQTSLLSANQIRVVCAKVAPLKEGELIHLNMTAIYAKLKKDYFLKIPCTILKIEEYQTINHAVLVFTDQVAPQFVHWYSQWLAKQHGVQKSEGINQSAFEFIFHYYQRLYCTHLSYSVIFSGKQGDVHAFSSGPSLEAITFYDDKKEAYEIPVDFFLKFVKHQEKESRVPVYVWFEKEKMHCFSMTNNTKISSKKIVSWLKNKPQWRVFLICNRKIVFPGKERCDEVKVYVSEAAAINNRPFEQSYSEHSTSTHILDISCLYSHIELPECLDDLSSDNIMLDEFAHSFKMMSFRVKRVEGRFKYKMALKLTVLDENNNLSIDAVTTDLSYVGLSVKIPLAEYSLAKLDMMSVEFSDWNDRQPESLLKKKELLDEVEYKIVAISHEDDHVSLGLFRDKRETPSKMNGFIRNKIEEIERSQSGGLKNNFDLYQSLLSSVWVTHNITGLPFFLGKDADGKRIIQAIASTATNELLREPFQENEDWTFLQNIAISLDIAVCKAAANNNFNLNMGIYCYFDDTCDTPAWITQTDLNFQSVADKANFITTAMRYKKHYFYHCSLIPITSGKDDILNGESSSFVSLAAHRLKEINGICNSLLAIGELNNVTRLMTFIFAPVK